MEVVARLGIANGLDRVLLCDPHGDGLPRFEPGAVLSLVTDPGRVTTHPLCHSLETTSAPDHWSILVHRIDGAARSSAEQLRLHVGDSVRTRGPRHAFHYVKAPVHVFVADRLGLVTLAPMIVHVDAQGERWRLHLTESIGSLSAVLPKPTNGLTSRVHDLEKDNGVRALRIRQVIDDCIGGASLYMCSDRGTLDEVLQSTTELHSHSGQLRIQVAESTPSGPRLDPEKKPGPDQCMVTAERSGVTVSACRGEPLLRALRTAGVPVPTSCEAGICGTCETTVIEGSVDHRDEFLSEDEKRSGETVMVCVSHCASRRLVLDI